MIICVTLNPCLDKTLVAPPWQPGQIIRATGMMEVAGGKGNNVARTLGRFGHDARPMTFLGGGVGTRVAELLRDDDGLEPLVVTTVAPTREILTVRTGDTAVQTAFIDPNPDISAEEHTRFRDLYVGALEAGDVQYVCLSGSSPCAELDGFWPWAMAEARRRGVPALLDTYGEALAEGLAAGPAIAKINRAEAEAWLDRPLPDDAALADALHRLLQYASRWAIITLGAEGAVAACGQQRWRLGCPPIRLCNPIGSGDAMAAALIHAELTGIAPERIARMAVAAGTANARVWAAGAIGPADLAELAPQVPVEVF